MIRVMGDTAGVEVATFRRDKDPHDGRRPSRVDFTDVMEEDAVRRDFTINSIFFDPIDGRYFDYVGGLEDLNACLIRTIENPGQSFSNDKLRMLRAVRFAARLGFSIEYKTQRAIRLQAVTITELSAERIRSELDIVLMECAPRRAFELLSAVGLLGAVFPELENTKDFQCASGCHVKGNIWQHTLLLLEYSRNPTALLAWSALLLNLANLKTTELGNEIHVHNHIEVGAEAVKSILLRLRFSNQQIKRILSLVTKHTLLSNVTEMRTGQLKDFLSMNELDEQLELHRMDCLARHGDLQKHRFVSNMLLHISVSEATSQKLICGRDLIALGYCPGPIFREILEWVEAEQLECGFTTKDKLLNKLLGQFPLEDAFQ